MLLLQCAKLKNNLFCIHVFRYLASSSFLDYIFLFLQNTVTGIYLVQSTLGHQPIKRILISITVSDFLHVWFPILLPSRCDTLLAPYHKIYLTGKCLNQINRARFIITQIFFLKLLLKSVSTWQFRGSRNRITYKIYKCKV